MISINISIPLKHSSMYYGHFTVFSSLSLSLSRSLPLPLPRSLSFPSHTSLCLCVQTSFTILLLILPISRPRPVLCRPCLAVSFSPRFPVCVIPSRCPRAADPALRRSPPACHRGCRCRGRERRRCECQVTHSTLIYIKK